ncbi:hypothetical protein [Haloarcula onubensis]|uniref:Uncharacterized protein n=1 Tax=Haloarcula onubensis TaxID=2950539 RepID=A0ABU2FVA3_9EURY|nr:hypothetical protein [Halomicroarcula sp. S3CR25-11]MDS0284207.1 hypothetical protein [Halomicroarcula sp. S3CR25-11]
MLVQLPDIDEAESLETWADEVASVTGADDVVVRAIATAVDGRDRSPETPWDAESSGRTYDWPANEHGDF